MLITIGYPIGDSGIDGIIGNGTITAIKAFQRDCNLTVTGSVDTKTWNKLEQEYNKKLGIKPNNKEEKKVEKPKYDDKTIPTGESIFKIPGTSGYIEQATDGRLIIHKDRGNYIAIGQGFGELKSKNSYRKVPCPKIIFTYLKTYKKVVNIDNRIVNYKNTISSASNIRREYKKLGYDISIHELRHTYATKLISSGMDFKTAANILGHDIEMTMKIYSHVTDEMMEHATNIIEKIF
ncbi:phage integrase family site-specific recombinase [Clostridium botulinum Af84]|uniref:peptidoglycan-binding protein n=1 Tax=Clostridium botulinum TaxID=1491 RepID=UPI00035BA885|nr:phage integrase family site-specific recombinase [Clostridium botulinum Af84]